MIAFLCTSNTLYLFDLFTTRTKESPMHDNLTVKQVEFIHDLLGKQWSLKYYSWAVWIMPIVLAGIEFIMHLYVYKDRSIAFSAFFVLIFTIYYIHLRKGSRQQILDVVRRSLITTEFGQAVAIYKERHPGSLRYICEQLNQEFGMELQT